MKVIPIIVLLAVGCYGELSLHGSFVAGVRDVDEVYLEDFLKEPVEQLKKAIIEAFNDFNSHIDSSLSRNASLAIRIIDQRLKNYNNLLEHHLPDVSSGTATATTFNQFLELMSEMYNVFLDLDQNSQGSKYRPSSLPHMDEIFVNLAKNVENYLDRLKKWTVTILTEGLANELKNLPAIQDEYRIKYLYAKVGDIQRYIKTLDKHEDIFRKHSTPAVWEEYKTTKDKLSQIKV